MQPKTPSSRIICLILIFLISMITNSACQPLSLKVEQVSTEGDYLRVQAPDCDYGGVIKAIEAIDKYTVRFSLCTGDPAFLDKLAFPTFAIQDQEYLSTHRGDSVAMSEQPNGSGPYYLKEFVPDKQLILEANPDYWGTPPKEPSIIFRWSSASASRLTDLRINFSDISDRPEANSYYSIRSDESLNLINRDALNVSFVGMNNEFPPFNDERIRRGISLLLERQTFVNKYYPLGSQIADQFISPALGTGYTPGYRWLDYNPKEGLDLLNKAEYDFTQILKLAYCDIPSDYLPNPGSIAQEIKTQLAEAGVLVSLVRMEPDEFENAIEEGKLAFYLSGWKAEYPDPANFFATIFPVGSKAFGKPYSDIIFMAKEAASNPDPDQRQSRYNRINELLRLHIPAIPLVHGGTALVAVRKVQGLIVGPMHENLEEVTLPGDRLRFTQSHEPVSLWPGDESDVDTLRVTRLIYDTLVEYKTGSTDIKPSLASYWETNAGRTDWTFYLRYGVKFSNGADLDANDVVASFAAQWDAADPNHTGRTGDFQMFKDFFGGFINEEVQETSQ